MKIIPLLVLLLGAAATAAPAEGDEDKFEGDMLLTEAQKKMLEDYTIKNAKDQEEADKEAKQEKEDLTSDIETGKSFAGSLYKWDGNTLYYDLDKVGWWRVITKWKINSALEDLEDKLGGCVKFRKRDEGPRVLVGVGESGCYSSVGYVARYKPSKVQELNLGSGCKSRGIIQHEFIHALGFFHMMSRSDRDQYVTVHEDNIKDKEKHNFRKYGPSVIHHFGLPFDYGSIMMYGPKAFNKNGRYTITAKDKSKQKLMGQRDGPSAGDIKMIRIAYGCD